MEQICSNAYEAGAILDPRTEFDMPIGICPCYQPKHLLDFPDIPKVCGNCEWYSVQRGGHVKAESVQEKERVPA